MFVSEDGWVALWAVWPRGWERSGCLTDPRSEADDTGDGASHCRRDKRGECGPVRVPECHFLHVALKALSSTTLLTATFPLIIITASLCVGNVSVCAAERFLLRRSRILSSERFMDGRHCSVCREKTEEQFNQSCRKCFYFKPRCRFKSSNQVFFHY